MNDISCSSHCRLACAKLVRGAVVRAFSIEVVVAIVHDPFGVHYLTALTRLSSSSAFSNRPYPLYVATTLSMLTSNSSAFLNSSCVFGSSVFAAVPRLKYVDARSLMVLSVSGCSGPSTLMLVPMTCMFSSSASFLRRSWFRYITA